MLLSTQRYPNGSLLPGTTYRILSALGQGGMGFVYEVMDENLEKKFVAKTLLFELGDRADLLERMRREARALAKLNHRNIVQVVRFDVTTDELRLPFLLMERLEGRSLRDTLDVQKTVPWRKAVAWICDVLRALQHAHDAGIVHRDVKPENIFLHRERDAEILIKLLDFGIVAQRDVPQGLTGDRFLGTLRYAAPEQILAEEITPQTDLYAAALVAYEMLTGESPFERAVEKNTLARAQLETPPPPLVVEGLPARVGRILSKALAKSPSDRPEDAKTMVRTLEEAIRDHDKVPSSARLPVVRSETAPSSPAPSPLRKSPSAVPPATEQPRAIGYATTDGQQGLVTSAGEGLGTKWRDTLLFLLVGVAIAGGGGIWVVRATRQTTRSFPAAEQPSDLKTIAAAPLISAAAELPAASAALVPTPTIATPSPLSTAPSDSARLAPSIATSVPAAPTAEMPTTPTAGSEPRNSVPAVASGLRPPKRRTTKKLPGSGLD